MIPTTTTVARATAVAMAAICALGARATAQDLVIRQLQCNGNEPFWSLQANDGSAILTQLGAEGPQETILEGKLAPFDFLRPAWRVWHGAAIDDPAMSVVATLRAETCLDTMSDETPPFDHRAMLVVAGVRPAIGCCRATYALDTDGAPIAEPDTKPQDDWSRQVGTLLPAIRSCVIDGGVAVNSVLHAGRAVDDQVSVRLEDEDGDRFDCRVRRDGSGVGSVVPATGVDAGEGEPRFLPAREMAPLLTYGHIERVVDSRGVLQGWLHYASFPLTDPADLVDKTWRLEDIEGRGVIDMLNSPMTVAADGSVSGHAGCNAMTGTAKLAGSAIEFGPLATTRRMCAESIMDQEQKFLAALSRVVSWRIENGLLYLADDGGRDILRFASES